MKRTTRARYAALAAMLLLVLGTVVCLADEYTVVFKNHSTMVGDVCIYQHEPDMAVHNVMSLAWFSKGAAPTTTISFTWSIDYCFAWDEIGELVPGVVFEADQIWDADLKTHNQITLTTIHGDIYTFADQTEGKYSGNLYILGDVSVVSNQVAVGIGMSGKPTHVAPAQPNWEWVYTPKPTYWITFGTFEEGEVLDIESISSFAKIQFPPNVYSMTAVLQPDNTWRVFPTSQGE